jgi:hypothetical protein
MENVRKPLIFNVKGNNYTIKTPTAGQLWQIEEAKSIISNGHYGNVMSNRTFWSEYNLDNIDMFSYFSILCPDLMKDIKVDSWTELDPFDLEELKDAYRKQFTPWFTDFTTMLKKVQSKTIGDETLETNPK